MLEEVSSDDDVPKATSKKQVTVNDEPEVFVIRPDTVEVEKQERPKRLFDITPTPLYPGDVDRIMQETADIIKFCEKKVLSQKLHSAKLGFMLIRIAKSLKEYENCMNQLNNFLVNGDVVTARFYINICQSLPAYGDYLKALEDVTDSTMTVQGMEGPVTKEDLENYSREIQENTLAGGMFLKTFRAMNKDINQYMQHRREIIEHITKQMGTWLTLKNAVVDQLDAMRDRLYKLSTYLDFVKSGETRIRPAFDISSFGFGSSFGDSTLNNSGNSSSFTIGDSFGSISRIEKL